MFVGCEPVIGNKLCGVIGYTFMMGGGMDFARWFGGAM